MTKTSLRSSHCNEFYALLLECGNLNILGLSYLGLSAWDHGSNGFFTPALHTLIIDAISGTSVDFPLWLSTLICASLPLSTLNICEMAAILFARSPEEEVQRWKSIFQSHGVAFMHYDPYST
ncbi:hypothetical protein BT69DRAFT_1281430 [Atractiella rhizophila]|nr:hypothetical protein BT69DRAFT_1281430 [Atractiella rhizophila]